MPDQGPNRKPDQATKDQIIEHARQGVSNTTIARDLNVFGQTVNGIVSNARRRGLLPQLPPKQKPPETVQMNPPVNHNPQPQPHMPAQPQPMPQPQYTQPAPQSSGPVQDDFTGGRPILGGSGGFSAPAQGVKYTVERMVPPDGLLGTHYGSFSVDELGQIYGEGTYKVTRHEPGRAVPVEFVQKIAASYGPSRSNFTGSRPQASRPAFGQRPWDRSQEDPSNQGATPPMRSPYSYVRPEQTQPHQDRSVYDFARNQAAAGDAALGKAIEMVGQTQMEAMKQIESARRSGPDTYLVKVLETQQEIAGKRWEEEIRREEQKRDAEEKKWERRQADERDRWERERAAEKERHERQRNDEKERYDRDQAAQKEAHDRELTRIRTESDSRLAQIKAETEERSRREKEEREERNRRDKEERDERERRASDERKFLLDLEERKLALVQKDAEIAQKRLESELQKTREDMKSLQEIAQREMAETREATEKHIENATASAREQYERDKDQLDREHKLKERALDKEHELNRQLIESERQIAQNQGGDQIFNTINTIIKEGSKALEKMVDLQKIKAMTPEAQTAYVARGASLDGNVLQEPAKQEAQRQAPPPPPPQVQSHQQESDPQPSSRMAASAQNPAQGGNGNGHAAPMTDAQASGSHMESIIREQMGTQLAQEIIEEWALYVESGSDATTFANLYLEMMRDPRSDEKRQACAAFAAFMKVRKWGKVYKVIRPFLRAETQEILDRPEAEGFYEQFRAMVILQIQDYWDQFVASKLPPGQGGTPPQGSGAPLPPPVPQHPSAQAPVEPQGALGDNGDAPQAPPVPSRDTLRPIK
jgi:hypothetical protein